MIDVIVADHEEVFGIGMMETLAVTDDVFLVVQTRSPDQLLKALQTITPKVLVLSTRFLAELARIEPVLKRNRTALLLLAEDNDQAAYVRWLRAGGVVFRSIDGSGLIDAMRRVARGELFIQDRRSDLRGDPSEGA